MRFLVMCVALESGRKPSRRTESDLTAKSLVMAMLPRELVLPSWHASDRPRDRVRGDRRRVLHAQREPAAKPHRP
jgi:hypothetical protein